MSFTQRNFSGNSLTVTAGSLYKSLTMVCSKFGAAQVAYIYFNWDSNVIKRSINQRNIFHYSYCTAINIVARKSTPIEIIFNAENTPAWYYFANEKLKKIIECSQNLQHLKWKRKCLSNNIHCENGINIYLITWYLAPHFAYNYTKTGISWQR